MTTVCGVLLKVDAAFATTGRTSSTGFSTGAAVIRVEVQIDTGVGTTSVGAAGASTFGRGSGTGYFTFSTKADFTGFAGCPAFSTMFCAFLKVDTGRSAESRSLCRTVGDTVSTLTFLPSFAGLAATTAVKRVGQCIDTGT